MASIGPNRNFNVENACKEINKSMKGFGTDEEKLIQVLTSHNNAQRQEIRTKYKLMYGKDLVDHIEDEVKGEFEEALVSLLYTPVELDAWNLHRAMDNIGTDSRPVIEILASRSNQQLNAIKAEYQNKYGANLDEDIKDDFEQSLESLLRALANATRPEDAFVDANQATEDAKSLVEAGEKIRGTNEEEFVRVLCSRSYPQLRKTFQEYEKLAGKDIAQSIEGETVGKLEDALLAVVECVRDVSTFYAKQLHDCFEGIGTRDSNLIRIIVSRSEVDLEQVKQKYQSLFGENLRDRVSNETNGYLEKVLHAIIKS